MEGRHELSTSYLSFIIIIIFFLCVGGGGERGEVDSLTFFFPFHLYLQVKKRMVISKKKI